MERPGTATRPLRIAVVGSGPAGFYTVQHLFRQDELECRVDMFDRLPTPFGLVRHGVAPDHPKIKSVTAVYHKLASRPEFRFYGNVEFGKHLSLDDLLLHYHQIVFCTGAETDRNLGVPGEDLSGSYSATEFVAWYNGHPDYSQRRFDLSCRRAVIVGIGNVAVDVARILCRTPEELAATDIADYALDALRKSRVREVVLLGRRGPAQAAFTTPEIRELGEMADATATTIAGEVELDELSLRAMADAADKATRRKVEICQSYAGRSDSSKSRRLVIRFLVSPTELLASTDGRVRAVRLVHNELVAGDGGKLRARATDRTEEIEAGLVFRSVGYRGVALPGLPFDERRGLIPNSAGRVTDPAEADRPLPGLYVSGWIKRGPSGVIGTNKPDAGETVRSMLEDLTGDVLASPPRCEVGAIETLLAERGARFVSYDDWIKLDAAEIEHGKPLGRPRVKFTEREAILRALDN